MQLVNRLQSITLALLAAFGVSTSAVAKVCVPEKTASSVFGANYDQSAQVDAAGTLDFAGREEPCSYELVSGRPKWLNRDPIGESGGINLDGMVSNDAVNRVDRLGLQPTLGARTTTAPPGNDQMICGQFLWEVVWQVSPASNATNGGQITQGVEIKVHLEEE